MIDLDRPYVGALLLVLGGFILLEIVLRTVLGLGSPPLMQSDAEVGYVYQADQSLTRFTNRVDINVYHQRSEPLRSDPESSFTRVLFLGDSVTWGGVLTDQSETYPELTEVRLHRLCNRPVEALNASAGSWGIPNLRAYAENYGLFESDAIVLQIGSHDLTQPKSTGEIVGSHPSYPKSDPILATAELMDRYLIPRLRAYVPNLSSHPHGKSSRSTRPRWVFRRNLDAFRTLARSIQDHHTPVVVVYTPNRGEVAVSKTGHSPNLYRQKFLESAERLDVPVLNLDDAWKGRAEVASYYRDHVHLNETGNAALADTLAPFLKRHLPSRCEANKTDTSYR